MYFTKEKLYNVVAYFREQLMNCGVQYPMNIFNVCNNFINLKIECVPFKTTGLKGMIAVATEEDPTHYILINSKLSAIEKNFYGLHELLHAYLHSSEKGKTFRCYDKIKPNQDYATEWQANEGAAELLIPYKDFIPYFYSLLMLYCKNTGKWTELYGVQDIYDVISNRYFASRMVVKNRIASLSYEIDQYANGTPISDIKLLSYNKREVNGISTTDYINLIQQNMIKYEFALDWDSVI